MLVAVSSPFATQAAPPDGAGLNPSLQNPYMMVHPPLLYLGFVGLTVPFAFAMGALLARRSDEAWIVATRRWTLAAWTFLGIGQLLGAHWAYVEVGWGGYYAWDPVENAALMPWLAATAFLHSVMIQEKRGMLKVWNVVLVVGAFALALFGTFLTRSGIVSSIHSFTESSIGSLVPGLHRPRAGRIGVPRALQAAAAAREDTARIARVPRGHVPLQQPAARRALPDDPLGGRLPDPLRGRARGADHGRRALLQLLPGGLRPSAAAVDGDRAAHRLAARLAAFAGQELHLARAAALVAGVILLALGAGSSPAGLIAYTFAAFVLGSIVYEFVRGTRARRALGGGSWLSAFSGLVARNRRRYGGYVVHASIVLLAIGIAGSSAYDTVRQQKLSPGQTMAVGDYRLTYRDLEVRQGTNAEELRAHLDVERDGSHSGRSRPARTTTARRTRSRTRSASVATS